MLKQISKKKIQSFQEKIFDWWKDNRRHFPWRDTTNPYHIMVSEIMLQQTQAPRVVEKYKQFVDKFPDFKSLANASQSDVLSIWSGLGYNRRAIWLQEAVEAILESGEFPTSVLELQKLKGIGAYSARSILIFSFNSDLATVDTNIRRILISEGFATESNNEKELMTIAEQLLPQDRSRDWHNALMDYGSIELTSSKTGIKPTSQQVKFKGSDREKRGKILKFLLDNRSASLQKLKEITNSSKKQLEPILEKMIKDRLIVKYKDRYQVE
jgi:A/G-specific adenine glycosylase